MRVRPRPLGDAAARRHRRRPAHPARAPRPGAAADVHAAVEPLHRGHGREPRRPRDRRAVARPHRRAARRSTACASCRCRSTGSRSARACRSAATRSASSSPRGRREPAPLGVMLHHAEMDTEDMTAMDELLDLDQRPWAHPLPVDGGGTRRDVGGVVDVKRAIVTGAAGFIGSHLSERLDRRGLAASSASTPSRRTTTAPTSSRTSPRSRARRASTSSRATSTTSTSRRCSRTRRSSSTWPPSRACASASARASPATRPTTSSPPSACSRPRAAAGCPRVVWASSSSVYGDAAAYPCVEASTPTAPRSPYGVTKRACEDLAAVYGNAGLEHRRPALLHRLRAAPAPRHGDAQALRGAARRRELPAVRRRQPVARLHPRRRRGRRHVPGRVRRRPGPDLQRRRRPRGHARRGHRAARGARRTARPCSTAAPPRRAT